MAHTNCMKEALTHLHDIDNQISVAMLGAAFCAPQLLHTLSCRDVPNAHHARGPTSG